MLFSREQHIIEMFSEEIVSFHSQIIKDLENVEFQVGTSQVNGAEATEDNETKEPREAKVFGVKQSKLSKSRLFLLLNFLGNLLLCKMESNLTSINQRFWTTSTSAMESWNNTQGTSKLTTYNSKWQSSNTNLHFSAPRFEITS